MLHIENICIAFGTEVLVSGFNMKLERGETACIVGQSGCGKTSLLNAIMGFVPLKEGIIRKTGRQYRYPRRYERQSGFHQSLLHHVLR